VFSILFASLFLIGGAADKVLPDFVRVAGGEKAQIVIIPFASARPKVGAAELEKEFLKLKAAKVTVLLPGMKTGLPAGTTAVYMGGGDQSRLKRLLKNPLLHDLSEFGGVIAGSSAGAMVVSSKMITGGEDGNVRIADGLDLLSNVIIDTHVGQRHREVRDVAALKKAVAKEVIGLDEDTAVYVKENHCTVYGAGKVHVFTSSQLASVSTAIGWVRGQSVNALFPVSETTKTRGDEFDLP
jgi:cyanophycinase